MSGISCDFYKKFDEKINQYLIFLVHVQQSKKIVITGKHDIFGLAGKISKKISVETKKYFSNRNDYNEAEMKIDLENCFNEIMNQIDHEIKRYQVNIENDKLFSLEEIIKTLTTPKENIYLLPADIHNMFFYKEFDESKKNR